jgi:raffinose/stachyose/melibiose transport system substrate-binding protein
LIPNIKEVVLVKKNPVRALSFLLCVFLLAGLLAGCSQEQPGGPSNGGQNQNGGQSEPPPTQDQDSDKDEDKGNLAGISVTLMASQNWIKDVDRELLDKFREETGIEVKVLVTPDNGYDTLLGTSLAGGSNAVDIFMYSAGSPMVSAGIPDVALDLSDEEWVSRLEEWAVAANSHNGKLYGFSTWGVDYEGILYNKTFFEENSLTVPSTWEEFVALCDKILELGKIPLYEPINGVWHAQTWFYGITAALYREKPDLAEWLNESKDNKLASLETAREALTELYEFLGAKENGRPKYYTNDGQAEDWFGSYPALINRETVMMATYSAYPAELKDQGSTDEWGMFPIPLAGNDAVVANGGGISKFINKNSDNIDACKELLNFLARKENLDTYYAARSDLVSASFKDVETVKPTGATLEAVERSNGLPPVMLMKDMLYWDPDIYKYFQGFADGTVTPDDFLNNMDNYRAVIFEAASGE